MCRQQLVPIRNFTCIVAYTWGGGERMHHVRDSFYVIFRLIIFFHLNIFLRIVIMTLLCIVLDDANHLLFSVFLIH